MRPRPLDERFWEKVDAYGDCWEWRSTIAATGYGSFWANGQARYAHRIAYELLVGPIPTGLHLDHLCRNRSCVNPDHLEAVTRRVNILRGQGATAANARKTHCPKGHPYSGGYMGFRICRTCRSEQVRAYKRRVRAVA